MDAERQAKIDEMQKRLVADDTFRRLLFEATMSQVCSSERRCTYCKRHLSVMERLVERAEEIEPVRRET